jgi:hypothetical protein
LVSVGLIVHPRKVVPFHALVSRTLNVLALLAKTDKVPALKVEPPPAKESSSIEGKLVDMDFPGACVELEGTVGSLVSLGALQGSDKKLIIGCTSYGREAAAEVLTAALAIATAQLTDGRIVDAALHWTAKEECTAEELVEALALREPQSNFPAAVELVFQKQVAQKTC